MAALDVQTWACCGKIVPWNEKMIKRKWKILTALFMIVIVLSTLIIANWDSVLENFAALILEDSTVYAPKYTKALFQKISPGMTKAEVFSLLGPPLCKSGDKQEYWHYSDQRKSNYRIRLIIFDGKNKVREKKIGFYVD